MPEVRRTPPTVRDTPVADAQFTASAGAAFDLMVAAIVDRAAGHAIAGDHAGGHARVPALIFVDAQISIRREEE